MGFVQNSPLCNSQRAQLPQTNITYVSEDGAYGQCGMYDQGKVIALSAFHRSSFLHFSSNKQILLYIYSVYAPC